MTIMTVYCTNVILHKCILETKANNRVAPKLRFHLPGEFTFKMNKKEQ